MDCRGRQKALAAGSVGFFLSLFALVLDPTIGSAGPTPVQSKLQKSFITTESKQLASREKGCDVIYGSKQQDPPTPSIVCPALLTVI